MNLHSTLANLRLQVSQILRSRKLLLATALTERLDELVEIESCSESKLKYTTVHGWRTLNLKRSELNQFFVFKKGLGFAKALALPYVQVPGSASQVPRLIVQSVAIDVATAGYARAVYLPYYIAGIGDDYPSGALVVRIDANNAQAIRAGYANAVKSVALRHDVYTEDKKMLDIEYADSLVDFPRFG